MNLAGLIEFLRKHLRNVVRVGMALLLALVVVDALFVNKEHAHTEAEHWWGFWAGFGFLACLAIIFVSKWFGHTGIMQREDYYQEAGAADNES